MTGRRPDSLPRRFARIYTAAITDVLDEMGLLRQTLPATIQPLAPGMRAAGYAFTARGRPHRGTPRDRDQTLRRFLGMISAVPADSVLVLAANDGVAAHFGELSAEWFRTHRVRGAVIDGATRDAAAIARLGFPTFVRYRTPQDSVPRWRVTDWGQPMTIGGVRIALGDVVVADLDGVVIVPGAPPTRFCNAARNSCARKAPCAERSAAASPLSTRTTSSARSRRVSENRGAPRLRRGATSVGGYGGPSRGPPSA